jgi:inner membrane protein
MNKPTHVMGGVTAGIAVNKFIVPTLTNVASIEGVVGVGAVMAGAFLGSVLPDIDHKGSFIGRRLKPISFILHHTIGHRGLTHTPIFVIGFSTLLAYLVMQLSGFAQTVMLFFVLGLFGGMVSHLALDLLTESGIPLFYPFSKKDISLAPFRTGGIGEYIASLACMALIFLMLQDVYVMAFVK